MSSYEIGPYSTGLGLATDIVSSVLLSISVIASSAILVAIYKLDNKNKLRARVLIGLFGSHVWAGLVFLGFISASFAGHPPSTGTVACEVSAFMIESSMWAQYLFAIAVAVVSFSVLLYPLSPTTLKLEQGWVWVLAGVCTLALAMAGLQSGVQRAVYIGGFCWNGSERNLFNELIGCAPRVFVFFVILFLYFKIFWYLRRRGKLSNAVDGITAWAHPRRVRWKAQSSPHQTTKHVQAIPRVPHPPSSCDDGLRQGVHWGEGTSGSEAAASQLTLGSDPASTQTLKGAPWEELHLSGLSQVSPVENNGFEAQSELESGNPDAGTTRIQFSRSLAFSIMTCGPLKSGIDSTESDRLDSSSTGNRSESRSASITEKVEYPSYGSHISVSDSRPSSLMLRHEGFAEHHSPSAPTAHQHDNISHSELSLSHSTDSNVSSNLSAPEHVHLPPFPSSSESIDSQLSTSWRQTHRNAYATSSAHTPYLGPAPVAERRARRERYETLHGLLTRKAAVLFLLFPLTYFILTVVCLTRLADDYAVGSRPPSKVIHAISRWALFLQGPLDCLTYGVMAFKVKKDVGKEIKRRWGRYFDSSGRRAFSFKRLTLVDALHKRP